MRLGAVHRTEHRPSRPCAPRTGVATIEKTVADALPAIVGQQDGLAEIEDGVHVDARSGDGLSDRIVLRGHGRGSRHADHLIAVQRGYQHGAGRRGEVLQIRCLVIHVAVVEIRPLPEHGDTQPGEVAQMPLDLIRPERLNRKRHGRRPERNGNPRNTAQPSTWRVQSARL